MFNIKQYFLKLVQKKGLEAMSHQIVPWTQASFAEPVLCMLSA